MIENQNDIQDGYDKTDETITRVTGMYKDWFLDYASKIGF